MSSFPAPGEFIPHRPPFLLIDEIVDMQPGVKGVGRWHLSGDEEFFTGHFPGRPTLPGVLMVESLAQLGAAVLLADDRFKGKLPLFGGIDSARFRRQVGPGDVLDCEIEMTRLSSRSGRGIAKATVEGQRACEAELLFVIAPVELVDNGADDQAAVVPSETQ